MAKVSRLYYNEGLTQDTIVEKLNLSRAKISRLLQQARDVGIVTITVNSPAGTYSDLEEQIEARYSLREVIVVDVADPESQIVVNQELGIAAANYLNRIIKNGDSIGFSWGTTLNQVVSYLQPQSLPNAQVVQIIGGLGPPESEFHATDLCRRAAQHLGCRLTLLPAPGIVDNQQIKDVILSDSHVQKAFNEFCNLTIAFVGIGAPTPSSVVMRDGSILTDEDLQGLQSQGAVGDIALHFFDANGSPISSDLDHRVIGISLEQLACIDRVVGISGGVTKTSAIQGALAGKLVDVLITDQLTARKLINPHF
jgi:DNA-binding transcriptional regulator LsrR (DeoR family)